MLIVLCLGEFYSLMSFVGTVLERSERSSSGALWNVLNMKTFFKQFMEKKNSYLSVFRKGDLQGTSLSFPCWYSSSDYLLSIYQVSIARSNRWYWWKGYWGDYWSKLFKREVFNNFCCTHIHDPTFLLLFGVLGRFLKYFMTSSVST